jgi:hypothetical protein
MFPPALALAAPRVASRPIRPGELPIRAVTVYSDQARVTRSGEWRLDRGVQRLEFPRLPQSIAPDSVRVEASGAKVTHVEVHPIRLGELPKTEAENLIDKLLHLHDEQAAIQDQIDGVNEELSFISSIRPHADPVTKEGAAPLLLNPTGWAAGLTFFDAREASLLTTGGDATEKLRLKQEEIARVEEQARQLLGAAGDGPGFVVTAVIEGRDASAKVTLSYLARGARWYPSYDVRYTPGRKAVDIGFSGLVQQETGEDWNDARLTLSTAIPTTVIALPQLAIWKIGDRERFIPTPTPGPPEGAPPQRRSPYPPPHPMTESEDVRARLQSALAMESEPVAVTSPQNAPSRRARMNYKTTNEGAYPAPPPSMAPAPMAPAMRAEADAMEDVEEKTVGRTLSMESAVVTGSFASGPARAYVSFASPVGWRPPSYSGDLPASLAGGYDFSYDSARPESIRTGAEGRRVPLFSGEYPAESWINILPALSHSAYLVAEVTNSGSAPWLRGQAHLFVGSDLVGDATVPTTAPGEKVTLPLGIDDAIRVERQVQTVSSERGLFSRLDVGAYEVSIELLNTRATPVPLRVKDQIPLARQTEVVIALDKTDPAPFKADREMKEDGALEWRLDLAAGAKQVLRFRYEVARPKNWRLWQTSTPGVSR